VAEGQDGTLPRAVLVDRLGSRVDRPLTVPSIVDAWPEAVQRPIILVSDIGRPLSQHVLELFPSLPSGPGLRLGGGV
jgi:hypothetical protein